MKKLKLLAIVVLSILFILPLTSLGLSVCPQNLKGTFSSCSDVCKGAQTAGHISGAVSVYGYIPSTGLSGFCSCIYTQKSGTFDVANTFCQYKVIKHHNKSITFSNPFASMPSGYDLAGSLVRMMSFQGSPALPGSSLSDIANVVYSAYHYVLTGLAIILATYFLAMAGGWALMSMPFSQLIRVLQQVTQGHFAIPLKAEVFSRAGMTVLAIAFFLLPVPGKSPILGSAHTVTYKGKQFAAPLAIDLASVFVDYGYNEGNSVASRITSGLTAYFTNKMNKIVTNEQNALVVQQANLLKAEKNLNTAIAAAGGSCGTISNCIDYEKAVSNGTAAQATKDPGCKKAIAAFSLLCPTWESYQQELSKSSSSWPTPPATIVSSMMRGAGSVSSHMGILSPSIMPIAFIGAALLGGSSYQVIPQEDVAKLTAGGNKSFVDMAHKIPFMSDLSGAMGYASSAVGTLSDFAMSQLGNAYNAYSGNGVQGAATNIYAVKPAMSNGFAFLLGQALVSSSIPPGSMMAGQFNAIAGNMSSVLSNLALIIPGSGAIKGSALGILTSMSIILRGMSFLLGIYVAYSINAVALEIIPFIVIAFAIGLRFIGYLFDIMRFFLSIPFYSVLALSREPRNALAYFIGIGKMVVYPIVLALSSSLGFFAYELSMLLFFKIPFTVIANTAGSVSSFFASFIFGAISMALYITATFIGTILGFEVTFHFPTAALESIQTLSTGISSGVSGQLSSARSALSRMTAGAV